MDGSGKASEYTKGSKPSEKNTCIDADEAKSVIFNMVDVKTTQIEAIKI